MASIRGRSGEVSDRRAGIRALRDQLGEWEREPPGKSAERISTGLLALDDELVGGGFRAGSLVEWLYPAYGSGTASLSLWVARQICIPRRRMLLAVDADGEFYPPAGDVDLWDGRRALILRPRSRRDQYWAIDQALRCAGVGVVWSFADRCDQRTFRRLQLASEEGNTLGFLLRSGRRLNEPSWADARLLVEPIPKQCPDLQSGLQACQDVARRWQITILRCRGNSRPRVVRIEMNYEANPLPLAAQLADPTAVS